MPTVSHSFRRLVLGMQPSAPDRVMRLAVELADLLDLELLGLFLEDDSLRGLAGIPFAREFRSLGGGWHPLDLDRLTDDLNLAARNLERMFTEAAKKLAARSRFEVVRGPVGESLASVSSLTDIVMIAEPLSGAERASAQFSWLIRAAFRSAAAVMLVPPRIARTKGPIVAIAKAADDPSIAAAAAIAIAAKETLVIIEVGKYGPEDLDIAKLAPDSGLAVQRVAAGNVSGADAAACVHVMRDLQERLVVMSRLPLDGAVASAIAAARQVPVLVIEPETKPPED
jgi:hypothetical protein